MNVSARAVLAILLATAAAADVGSVTYRDPPSQEEQVTAAAERLMDRRFRRRFANESFDIVSDSPEGTAASILGGNFEAIFGVLDTVFPAMPATGTEVEGKTRAYLFRSLLQYRRFEALIKGVEGRSSGMYFPREGILAFHLEMYTQPPARHVMVHECTHAYLGRMLRTTANGLPSWLDEGLAEYVANSEVINGRIQLGSYLAKELYENPNVTRILPTLAAERLSAARRAARRKDESLSFDYLFGTKISSINDDKRHLEFYGTSWLLIDYLRHGKPEWAANSFPEFITRVAGGEPARETFEQVYGLAVADAERMFRAHVKEFELPRRRPGARGALAAITGG